MYSFLLSESRINWTLTLSIENCQILHKPSVSSSFSTVKQVLYRQSLGLARVAKMCFGPPPSQKFSSCVPACICPVLVLYMFLCIPVNNNKNINSNYINNNNNNIIILYWKHIQLQFRLVFTPVWLGGRLFIFPDISTTCRQWRT